MCTRLSINDKLKPVKSKTLLQLYHSHYCFVIEATLQAYKRTVVMQVGGLPHRFPIISSKFWSGCSDFEVIFSKLRIWDVNYLEKMTSSVKKFMYQFVYRLSGARGMCPACPLSARHFHREFSAFRKDNLLAHHISLKRVNFID